MSNEPQDQTLTFDMPLIESGWEKPVTPVMAMLRPPGVLPRPTALFAASSESPTPATKSNA